MRAPSRDALRARWLAGAFGRKYFQDVVKRGEQPRDLWRALADAGFLGAHVPEEFGGSGGGLGDLNIVVEEIAAQGCPLLSLGILAITAPILAAHGSDAQKTTWLPKLADGTRKMCFAITEPDAGSNTHRIKTAATRGDSGWVSASGSTPYQSISGRL